MTAIAMTAIALGALSFAGTSTVLSRAFPVERKRKRERPADQVRGAFARATSLLARLLPQSEDKRRALADRIESAGRSTSPEAFRAATVATALAGAVMGLLLSPAGGADGLRFVLLPLVGGVAGIAAPRLWLSSQVRRRREQIDAQLPSALEMLSASVKAGLSMERALDLVSRRTDGAVAEEFSRAVKDVTKLDFSTPEAMRRMEQRCQVPSMTLFAASVCQAMERGSAIGDVLASQARIARQNHFQRIEERANRIPTKMVIPLILFILPGTLIVSLAPAAMQIMQTFTSL